MIQMPTNTQPAIDSLCAAMRSDPEYAWGWWLNFVDAACDEGVDPETAERIATRYLRTCFGVDVSAPVVEEWPEVIDDA
jgi:hypothetical protein